MTRRKTRIVGAIAGVIIAGLSATSCVSNDGSLIIIGVLAPPIAATGGACAYTANIIGPFLSYGTMDVAFTEQYVPTLLIGNQMVPVGNASTGRVETDNVILQGAIVRVTDAAGATIDNYTVPGDGFVIPASGGTAGITAFATTLISPTAADAARQATAATFGTKRLVSYIKVFGTTTGGTHIESAEVGIPVDACFGCLVSFPNGSDDPAQAVQPNCLASTSSSSSTVSAPCVFGQDQYIDCRSCQGNIACDPSKR